jgi:predicted permease
VARPNPGGNSSFRPAEFLDYQEQNHVFEDVIGGSSQDVLYSNGEGTEQLSGAYVTPNMFRFLGVPALLGRTLTEDDGKPGAAPVFVMSYKAWTTRFNQDRSILGRTYTFNNTPATLVGIMPLRFTKLGADIYQSSALSRGDPQTRDRFYFLQARLKPGVTLRQAEADLTVVAKNLAKKYPKNYPKNFTVQVETWLNQLVGQFRKTLYTLVAAVFLLLLIACANVANMLLARATVREKEMAIRGAIGASRSRLIWQLLIESLLLAGGGAVAGCLLAYAGIKALAAVIPEDAIPREAVIHMNMLALLFSLGLAVFTVLLFGLVPAFQTAKTDIVGALKDSGRGVTGGFRRGRLRGTLVVVEVALSFVLLTGAGLLMRTFVALQTVDLGLNPDNILVARLPLPRGQYTTAAAKQRFFRALLGRLHNLPGVVAATETSTLPPYGGIGSDIEIPGKVHGEKWNAIYQLCSEGYFPTLDLHILRGRVLSAEDVNFVRKVAVVNQTFAKKYFGREDPLGAQVEITMLKNMPSPDLTVPIFQIVGIVADAKNQGIRDAPLPEMFIPYTVTGTFERGILVRTSKDPLGMLNAVRHEIWSVDRNVALTLTGSLKNYLKQFSYSGPRFAMILIAVFAGVGLVLVSLGVYSVIAYTVSRQTNEIGIRMALGARESNVFRMVLGTGLRLIVAGAIAGSLASIAVTRLLQSQLWGVSPYDPLTLVCVVAVIAAVGLIACFFPARRATRVDPMLALRHE